MHATHAATAPGRHRAVEALDREAEHWGPAVDQPRGRRRYLIAMLVAVALVLGGIVFLAVQGDEPRRGDMPGMDMDGMDM